AAYCQIGLELLPENVWDTNYQLVLDLHRKALDLPVIQSNDALMVRLIDQALNQTKTRFDKADVYRAIIRVYEVKNQLSESMNIVLEALRLYDVDHLEAKLTDQEVEQTIQAIYKRIDELGATPDTIVDNLLSLSANQDPDDQMLLELLGTGVIPAYYGALNLFLPIMLYHIQYSLQKGPIIWSGLVYAFFGGVLCGRMEIERGYQFGQVALQLAERLGGLPSLPHLVAATISPWKEHIRDALPICLQSYQDCLELGQFSPACNSLRLHATRSYWVGKNLVKLEQEMRDASQTMERLKQHRGLLLHNIDWQAVSNLIQPNATPWEIAGPHFDEKKFGPVFRETKNSIGLLSLFVNKIQLLYLFGHYEEAVTLSDEIEAYANPLTASPYIPLFYFYNALSRLALIELTQQPISPRQQTLINNVKVHQIKMRQWADHAPMNFLHKFLLIEAELARVNEQGGEARELYDQAIDLAIEHGYINDEAVACEVAGRFYLARGQTRQAQTYLYQARYAYQQWGAKTKLQNLDDTYTYLWPNESSAPQSTLPSTTTNRMAAAVLDIQSIIKATQALSGQIMLDQLLETLMHTVIENAGAEKGYLILPQEGRWFILAAKLVGETGVTMQEIPLAEATLLSQAIVRYVIRTRENIVLNNATQSNQFATDPYISQHRPKSILCSPLINQGRLNGILYLENNLAHNTFTPERVEILNVLSTQAAISIENATLYQTLEAYSHTLEQKVDQRT
ncbi:MAG: GAF domain-containing protein, partial [Chloroflexota bacterium]